MPPKVLLIHSNQQLAKGALELKAYAVSAHQHLPKSTSPGYSATEAEAIAKAAQHLVSGNDAAFANTRWFLIMPMKALVVVMLSIDVLPDGNPVWHLSMSSPAANNNVGRTPEMFAIRVLKAFFGDATVTEGPPEGAFKKVRHFRTPYLGTAESSPTSLGTAEPS